MLTAKLQTGQCRAKTLNHSLIIWKEVIIIKGIYSITNTINHKRYIGCSENIDKRWNAHKNALAANRHSNFRLQEDYNQYGSDSFEYEVIKQLPDDCTQTDLYIYEMYWIDFLKTTERGYNLNAGGPGKIKPTDDVKAKFKPTLNAKPKSNPNYGLSPFSRPEEANGMWGKHHSEETKKLLAEQARLRTGELSPRKRPVQASTGEVFILASDAAKWAGLSDPSGILKCCNGIVKHSGIHPVTKEKLSWTYRDDLR